MRSGATERLGDLLSPGLVTGAGNPSTLLVAGSLTNELGFVNSSTGAVVGATYLGFSPSAELLYPSLNELFVAAYANSSVVVLNSSTLSVIGTVPVPGNPISMVVDSRNSSIFVASANSAYLTEIDPANLSVERYSLVENGIVALGYVISSNEVIVSGQTSVSTGNLTFLNGSTGGVISSVAVNGSAGALAVDETGGRVFFDLGGPVDVVSAVNRSLVGTVGEGTFQGPLAYDPSTDALLEAVGPTSVAAINSTTGSVTFTANVGPYPGSIYIDVPQATAYVGTSDGVSISAVSMSGLVDRSLRVAAEPIPVLPIDGEGEVAVGDFASASIQLLNENGSLGPQWTTGSTGVENMALDDGSNQLFSADWGIAGSIDGENLSVLNATSGSLVNQVGLGGEGESVVDDPSIGAMLLSVDSYSGSGVYELNLTDLDVSQVISIPGGVSGITLDSSNGNLLAAIDGDKVAEINIATRSISGSVNTESSPDQIVFDGETGYAFVSDTSSNVVQEINISTLTVSRTFPVGISPTGLALDPATGALLVANSGSNNLSIISPGAATGELSVGLDPQGLTFDPGTGCIVATNAYSGTVSVIAPGGQYVATFSEIGLPAGTTWGVNFNGSDYYTSAGSLWVFAGNGSFRYSPLPVANYAASPSSGILNVSGANQAIAIAFAPVGASIYPIEFTEVGLPSGTLWSVNLSGASSSSSTATLQFRVANGTYSYGVSPPPGYIANSTSGTLSVRGEPVNVYLRFTARQPTQYLVTFVEQGLATGVRWNVTVNGTSESTSNSSLVAWFTNGTYPYSVGDVGTFVPTEPTGELVVAGRTVAVNVTFREQPNGTGPPGSTQNGSAPPWFVGLGWAGIVLLVAVVGGVTVAVWWRRRRSASRPPSEGTSDESTQAAR